MCGLRRLTIPNMSATGIPSTIFFSSSRGNLRFLISSSSFSIFASITPCLSLSASLVSETLSTNLASAILLSDVSTPFLASSSLCFETCSSSVLAVELAESIKSWIRVLFLLKGCSLFLFSFNILSYLAISPSALLISLSNFAL